MSRNVREEVVKLIVDGKQVTGSINELSKAQTQVKRNLRGMTEGSKEYNKEAKKLESINKNLGEQRKRINSIGKEWKSQKGMWERAKTTFAGTFAALSVQGAIGQIQQLGARMIAFVKNLSKQRKEITKLTGATGRDLDITSSKVQSIVDTFEKGFDETLVAANGLAKSMGIELNEALSLIQQGFINGADSSGKFLDILKEYPTQLKAAGLSAEQSIALIQNQVQSGIFSDKGIDSIKEATIRLRELTPATRKALDAIGLSSDEIENKLRSNTITYFEAIQMVSKKLNQLEDQSPEVGTAIADIFGGAGEDAGLAYLKTLGDIDHELEVVENSTSRLVQANERLALAYQKYNDDNGFWSDIVAGWKNFLAWGIETSSAIGNTKMQMDQLAVAAALVGKELKEVSSIHGATPAGKSLIDDLNDKILNLEDLSKAEITTFLTQLRTAQQETNDLSKSQIEYIRILRKQFSEQLDLLNNPPKKKKDPVTPGSTSAITGKTNMPEIDNLVGLGLDLNEIKHAHHEFFTLTDEFKESMFEWAGEINDIEGEITTDLQDNVTERNRLRYLELEEMRKIQSENEMIAVASSVLEATTTQERVAVITNSIRQEIKARIAQAIARQITTVLGTVPWPFNVALAGAAALGVGELFDNFIPSFYFGGDTGSKTLGFGDQYGGFTGMTHANEYVIPAAQRSDPYVANTEQYMEGRKKYGPMGNQKVDVNSTLDASEFNHTIGRFIGFMDNLEKNGIQAFLSRRTFEDATNDYQDKEKNREKGRLRNSN